MVLTPPPRDQQKCLFHVTLVNPMSKYSPKSSQEMWAQKDDMWGPIKDIGAKATGLVQRVSFALDKEEKKS